MGRLSIVLHTHMPYVEGFDTWPFGEEWLWEAVATSYLPVLDVLERRAQFGRRLVEIELVRRGADVADEGQAALDRTGSGELVAQHRRQRDGDRRPGLLEHVKQRQVARRDRLPQPLLAERPRVETLHVWEVRM